MINQKQLIEKVSKATDVNSVADRDNEFGPETWTVLTSHLTINGVPCRVEISSSKEIDPGSSWQLQVFESETGEELGRSIFGQDADDVIGRFPFGLIG